jgi:hypothetical protein
VTSREVETIARAMSLTAAGSCSGGDSTHLSSGFIMLASRRGAGVPGLGMISIGLLEAWSTCGEAGLGPFT